jgi:Cdc6-like AAA superfamily ATPase
LQIDDLSTITFSAYQSHDLENLMRGRLEDASVVDPKAISYIAKKYANVKGDARPAMEVLTTALKAAKERAANFVPMKSDGYIVKLKDVFPLCTEFTKLTELISRLPSHAKLMVSAAVYLGRKNKSSEVYLTHAEMIHAFKELFYKKFGNDVCFDKSEALVHMQTLDDIGLADVRNNEDVIVFNHTPEELDAAVADSLGKESDFFNY